MSTASISSDRLQLRIIFYLLLALPIIVSALPIDFILGGSGTLCLSHVLFGRDCYGCGTTHALVAFAHGDFAAACRYNVNVIIVAPLLTCEYLKLVRAYHHQLFHPLLSDVS